MPVARKRSPLTAEQRALAEQYVPLAVSMSRRVAGRFPRHRDDLFSAAMFALVQAAESYDPASGVKFGTFAGYRIQGAMKDALRAVGLAGWKGKPGDAPDVKSLCPGDEYTGRVLGSEHDAPVGEDLEERDAVEPRLRWLPARHAEVCRAVFVRGESHDRIASRMGCGKSWVNVIKQEALEMLRAREHTPTA